ncbi:hypothetical protein GLU60_02200 [Nanohaloarchaea archaeon H01]|nr:hypothetical protein [Nanohaloarchaea archaeon H01]
MSSPSRLIPHLLFLGALLLAGISPTLSFGGDGNISFRNISNKTPPDIMCTNDLDDNEHDGKDTNDLACVQPIKPGIDTEVLDKVEGNIWDTDLSQTMGGPKSEGIMFSGTVYRGVSTKTFSNQDSTSSGEITENYIDEARSESEDWAFGKLKNTTYDESDFPSGPGIGESHFKNGRVIYPPNTIGDSVCGDGLQNQNGMQPNVVKGNTAGVSGDTECAADYGEIYEKYHVRAPYGVPETPDCGSDCPPSPESDNGPGYTTSGDSVVEHYKRCDPDIECTIPGSCGPSGCSTATAYSNEHDKNYHDCNQHNKVSEFGDSGPDTRNDAARTYTEFTAHQNSATSLYGAWCGFEFTTTVDADGSEGEGDGLVAVRNGNIMGTLAHDGANKVGNRVYVNGENKDARSEIDTSCPGEKTACLIYADFYTKDSGWSTNSGGGGYKDGVKVEESKYTADQSYSVCRMMNKVASNDGTQERIVNCDYYKDGEPTSPLEGACGDDPLEKLVAAEGPQVDEDSMQRFLAFQQECVKYEDNSGPGNADAGRYDSASGGDPSVGISAVNFADIFKSSGVKDYRDYTGTGTKLRPENSYALRVTLEQPPDRWFQNVRAWIDWNQNGEFESSESYRVGECASPGCTVDTSIEVPSDASTGVTAMRVFHREFEYPDPGDSVSHGEVEDYSVEVTERSDKVTENPCVLDGKVYPEGSVVDVQDQRSKFYGFEVPGDSSDPEVCVGIDDPQYDDVLADDRNGGGSLNVQNGDNGGEWWDLDNRRVTEYLRNNDVDSGEWRSYWNYNTDQQADESTGVRDYNKKPGMALEDDCARTAGKPGILPPYQGRSYDCEDDEESVGREPPFYAEFREGTTDDDYPDRAGLETQLPMVHNRVQSGGGTGHEDAFTTRSTQTVQTTEDWSRGTQLHDMKAEANRISSTEDRNDKDLDKNLMGESVYGVYTSKVFGLSDETVFENLTIDYDFSGGTHPVLVEYSDDQSFTNIQHRDEFQITSGQDTMEFPLTSQDHEYMRFKIGIAQAPTSPQVAFTVDESGSMGGVQNAVQTEIASFFRNIGTGSEGVVIGGINGDVTPGTGFNTDANELETAANSLQADGGPERPETTVEEAVNYNGAGYEYTWDATAARAVIWLQDGGSGETCDGLDPGNNDVGDYMVNRNFKFYSATTGAGGCRGYYDDLASQTGGQTFDLSGNPNFDPILDSINTDLNTIPVVNSVNTVKIGSKSPPPDGGSNSQDNEPASVFDNLAWHDNAEIEKKDDEWALTPNLEWAIANDGTAWPPGQCHGALREQGVDKHKRQAIYANSYARAQNDVYTDQASGGRIDGNWINPDRDTLSVTSGGITCDLTGHDWGYAVQTDSINGINSHRSSDFDREGDPTSTGTENVDDIIPVALTVEKQELAWDKDGNPGDMVQDDLKQWKDACGDDRNEYLIREHAAKLNGEYNPTFTGREEYYACADRPTDCVLDGKVYSEGQIVDVSDVTVETNIQSDDEEICIDRNDELPGGEWWDVDNQNIRDELIGKGGPSSEVFEKTNGNTKQGTELFVREGQIDPSKPGEIYWHDSDMAQTVRKNAIIEAKNSPYSPLGPTNFYGENIDYWKGYALEDDCDSDLGSISPGCDDKGISITRGTDDDATSDLIYSHFRESKDGQPIKADDFSTEDSWVVRMYVNGGTDHDKGTNQMNENTDGVNFDSTNWGPEALGGWPTAGLNDSKIDPLEDTWAISSETYDAVGPTGSVYDTGQCHGRSPPQHSEGWVLKNETIMANSFANRTDVNSDGHNEGNWVNPDTTERTVSRGILTCDLNSTDWGIGYDLGPGSSLNVYEGDARSYGYNITDRHAVSGPIAFDYGEKPLDEEQDDLKQYPDACGDDQNEFLIREQYSSYHGGEIYPNLTDRDDIYACADRITDCAYNGAVYSEGQTLDISSQTSHDQEMGEQLPDEEICLDLNKSTPGGEWYDKDQEFTLEHRIKGLEETFNVSNPSTSSDPVDIDISGVVEGESGGAVSITDREKEIDSDGSFSLEGVAAYPGEMQLLRYYNSTDSPRQLEAQIRLRFPSDESNVKRVHISPELMYNGSEVWSGMETFSDHDFDRNKYNLTYNSTDWRNQTTRYDRTDLAYFNRTGEYYSPPSHRTNVRGQQKRYYSPEGYATEDDCGPLLSKSSTGPCGDVGDDTQHQSWFSAGNFTGMAP